MDKTKEYKAELFFNKPILHFEEYASKTIKFWRSKLK